MSPADGISLAVEQISSNYYPKSGLSGARGYWAFVNLLRRLEQESTPEIQYFACALQTHFSIQFQKLALRGWRDSIYQWAEGSTTRGLSFRFPALYHCIGGRLTTVRKEKIEKQIRYELVNCLTATLIASEKDIPWPAETLMIRILNFVTAVCCNWDLQEEAQKYADGGDLKITNQDSFEEIVHNYYAGLEKALRAQFALNEADGLNGLTPIGMFASAFETEGLQKLRDGLEESHRKNAGAVLANLAAILEPYDPEKDPDGKRLEDIAGQFQTAEKALALLREDTSYGSTVKELKNVLAELEKKIASGELTAEDMDNVAAELHKAAQAII